MDDSTQVLPKVVDQYNRSSPEAINADLAHITRRQPHAVHVRTIISVDNTEIIFDASASGDIDTREAMTWLRRAVDDVVGDWIEAKQPRHE